MRPVVRAFRARFRADRAGGELGDWLELLARLLGTPGHRITVAGGPIARMVARLCAADAVTLGRAILFSARGWRLLERRSAAGLILLAHEAAHVAQYRRLGSVSFLRAYAFEYLSGRLRGRSHDEAYRAISFEREARVVERAASRLLASGALLRGVED